MALFVDVAAFFITGEIVIGTCAEVGGGTTVGWDGGEEFGDMEIDLRTRSSL